jgi:amino acid transporter
MAIMPNEQSTNERGTGTDGLREAAGADLKSNPWVFAGWGQAAKIDDLGAESKRPPSAASKTKLGQWRATAICGNDITSSVLYVAALCTLQAGIYAPLALGAVGIVLYLFRSIYAEVGSALPLNGGAYNVLLNTTSKFRASVAACLTLLSYVVTAVISSTEALHYLHSIAQQVPVFEGTIALLAFFVLLNIVGIQESSTVALFIFVAHMATLTVIVVASGLTASGDLSVLLENLQTRPEGGFWRAMLFGFAAGMLGISGTTM